jgi:hypothetical protein
LSQRSGRGVRQLLDLVTAVKVVSDEDLANTGAQARTENSALLEVIPGQCYAHYEHHADELRSSSGDEVP